MLLSREHLARFARRVYPFFLRQSRHSFETMFGFFCVWASLTAFLNFGITANAFTQVIGPVAATLFNIVYLLAGIAIYFGIGFGKGNIEGAGLILLAASLLVRVLASAWLLGWNPITINGHVLNAAIVVGCGVRLYLLFKVQQVLEANDNR